MKLFKRRAKPDSGTSSSLANRGDDGASTDEVEPGQMPELPVVDSTFQSGVEQAGDSEPRQRLRECSGVFGMG
ncbi:MAG: hypothetical protein CM15mP74_12730 [Halieaceae bacterium]|nr:MAG: hypothetical protein CM15mP74_12730 [Halieaceae bacterium]